MTKRTWIVLLVGVNLVLGAYLVSQVHTPQRALAQAAADRDRYLLIAARARQANDVIYLVDVDRRRLHAFRAESLRAIGGGTRVFWTDARDLRRDFVPMQQDQMDEWQRRGGRAR